MEKASRPKGNHYLSAFHLVELDVSTLSNPQSSDFGGFLDVERNSALNKLKALALQGSVTTALDQQLNVYAVVDGQQRLTVPSFVADQLGIIRLGHTDADYADGRVEEVDTTEGIQIEMLGRTVIRDAMVLGKQVLIGVTVLEDLDLLVDCKRQRVMPPPDRPDQPVFRV